MKSFAKLLSIILHPILLPSLFSILLFESDSYLALLPIQIKFIITLVIFFTTFILPASSMPILKSFGVINSYEMEDNKERLYPMFITILSYSVCFVLLMQFPFPVPGVVYRSLVGGVITLLACMAITYRWKISAHTAGMGGFVASILGFGLRYGANIEIWFAISLVLLGLVSSARLYLKSHTPLQVTAGFILGFSAVIISIFTI